MRRYHSALGSWLPNISQPSPRPYRVVFVSGAFLLQTIKMYVTQLDPLAAAELDRGLVLTPGLLENSPSNCTAWMFLCTWGVPHLKKPSIFWYSLLSASFSVGLSWYVRKRRKNGLLSISYISYSLSNIVSWIALEYSKKLRTGI